MIADRLQSPERPSANAHADALDWTAGSYVVVRLSRDAYRDKIAAAAEVGRRHPGATVKHHPHARMWVFWVKKPAA